MNFHDRLEEYLNNSKYNNKNLIKLDDEKSEKTIKLSNRNTNTHDRDSYQISIIEDSSNLKNLQNYNTKTLILENNTNNNHLTYEMENINYKNLPSNKTNVLYNTNTSIISHHNYTTIENKKPNFTESIAYNTRNYSTIIKDCLNFYDVNNMSV